MAEDEQKADPRFDYIKERITAAFPKNIGPKYDKQMSGDDIRQANLMGCVESLKTYH
jgi:hypothetical protein